MDTDTSLFYDDIITRLTPQAVICREAVACPQCLAMPGCFCLNIINGEIGTKMRFVHYRRAELAFPLHVSPLDGGMP